MADHTTVSVAGMSPEEVALKLLDQVANCEKRSLMGGNVNGYTSADREYVLSTYAECLHTVKHFSRHRTGS